MDEIQTKLKSFIEKESQQQIKDFDQNLVNAAIIDSFLMIQTINFIEKEFGKKVEMEKIHPENFNSINTISEYIKNARD